MMARSSAYAFQQTDDLDQLEFVSKIGKSFEEVKQELKGTVEQER